MKRAVYRMVLAGCLIGLIGLSACQEAPSGNGMPPPNNRGTPPPPAAAPSWSLVLTAFVPDPSADSGMASNRLKAGQDSMATDLFDNGHDVRALSLLGGSIAAYFDHSADYDSSSNQIWYDIRAVGLPKTWDLVVEANNGLPVTLSWTLPAGDVNCATNQFHLKDDVGVVTDLCATASIQYTADGLPRTFALEVL